jgi:hypothetical protein
LAVQNSFLGPARHEDPLQCFDSFDVVLPKAMMRYASSTPAPEAPRRTEGTSAELADKLWEKVLETTGQLAIHSGCEQQLRGIVQQGAERMFTENRTTQEDVTLAEENIGRLIDLMKHHAELLNHPQWLGEDTLGATDRALQVMRFELWPFWPW